MIVIAESDASLKANLIPEPDGQYSLAITLTIHSICLFQPVIRIVLAGGTTEYGEDSHQAGWHFNWLPQGTYEFLVRIPSIAFATAQEVRIAWGTPDLIRSPDRVLGVPASENSPPSSSDARFQWVMSRDTEIKIRELPWQSGHENWFFRHFDHAASVIGTEFLRDTPLLSGRVLDIGAGDGITDLGLFLRYRPQELVAIDIVDYIYQLPDVARQHGLPLPDLPDGFRFIRGSADEIPYPDGHFDIVISWGSVEHIKGGYRGVLDEVWRLLKPGGLFFVNPGLYYAPLGSHLGEFFPEPHHHLRMSEADLREQVLASVPARMDRAGFDASSTEYWRFYKELNKIRVAEFEAELKAYGYRVVRAALRVNQCVEYDDSLQAHSIVDLATEDAFFVLEKPVTAKLK